METLLKSKVKNSGFKQSFLANKIGVTSEYFSMCINGKRRLNDHKQNELKNILKPFFS